MGEKIVSFPNLGLDLLQNIKLNRVAFTLPIGEGVDIYWYGIIITLGIIAACTYVMLRAKQNGIVSDDILDMAIFTIVTAVICARLYYVLTSLDEFIKPSFLETLKAVVNVRNGGLAIYGAIIGGAIASFCVCKFKKINVLKIYDILCPAVMLGQMIGRWGNFVNVEAYGDVTKYCFFGFETATPNAITFPLIMHVQKGFSAFYAHPTFFYEFAWNLLGFILINIMFSRKKYDGQIFLSYFAFYGIGRAFIEGFRSDSLMVGGIRISQFLGFVSFIVCALLLIVFALMGKKLGLGIGPAYHKKAAPAEGATEEENGCEYADEVTADEESALCEQDSLDGDPSEIEEDTPQK
ncbi:MAG: prolipoprotein diacylglyceryl transferase [Ruminococcaceae bacterium]|nr:prolipoprotein diacylglyceryl transferase [Oscillospiraceae bacterium]